MNICKLCQQECSHFVNAHIIPRGFYKSMRVQDDKGVPFLLMSNTPGTHRSQTNNGIYDDHLVCENCERRFSQSDTYAINFLLRDINFSPLVSGTSTIGWMGHYNYELLKFFFITLLWRAGATTQPFFKAVDLGPHLSRLGSLILSNDSGSHQDYAVFLGRYEDELGRSIIMDPHRESKKTFDGLNFYRFHLGSGFVAYIKVDNRPLCGSFESLFLGAVPDKVFVISRGDFTKKQELRIATDIIEKSSRLNHF